MHSLVPTLCVGTPGFDAPRHTLDAERRRIHDPGAWEREERAWERENVGTRGEFLSMDEGNFITRILFRPKTLLLLAAAVSAIAFFPLLSKLLPDLNRRAEYLLATEEIVITPPAKWVPKDLLQQVIEQSGLPKTVSILDKNVNAQLAEAFGRHPWVEEVVEIRKTKSARIEVELIYRNPVVMIEVPDGMYPVTAAGFLLPPKDFSGRDVKFFPVVQNAHSRPQGPAGTTWGDLAVTGAAQLASVLEHHWREFDLIA
ncbi:MAG: hypothetical protein IH899_18785, partial [Planctomycetes bacterium]|nr:hypothetical protein [Planctomycetota bacterium]